MPNFEAKMENYREISLQISWSCQSRQPKWSLQSLIFSTMCLSLPIQTCFLCDLEKGTSLLISFTSNKIRLIYFTINCPPNLWHTVSMSEWMYRIFCHKPVSWSSVGLEAVCGTGIDRESAGKVPCRHPFPFRFIPAVVSALLSLRKSSLRLCFPWTQFWMH